MRIAAIILAAGQSRRFGSDKRVALLADGRPMLAATLQLASRVFHDVFVAVQADDSVDRLKLPADSRLLFCADSSLGMGHTLANAIAQLPVRQYDGVAVLLGDMPWIRPDTLHQLAQVLTAEVIVYPLYQEQRGHPVLFGRQHWPALLQLSGDQGARRLIEESAPDCRGIPVNDPDVLRDADTPSALI